MTKYLLLLLLSSQAYAYPIFYQCEKGEILGEIESGQELEDSLKSMKELSPEELSDLSAEYCKGSEECLSRLKQAGILSKVSYEIIQKYYQEEISKLDKTSLTIEVPSSSIELIKKLKSMKELIACRKTAQKIKSPRPDMIQLFYPFNSNYMFATGCTNLETEECSFFRKDEMRTAIKRSLSAGVDPYLFMALSMQEQGVGGSLTDLYLDPIGLVKTMGCEVTPTVKSASAFESFQTYYKVKSGVVNRPDITEYLKDINANKDAPLKYFCHHTKDSDISMISESPRADSCCLKVPGDISGHDMSTLLTPLYIKNMQKNPIPFHNTDPAFTVQSYNGFSDLMGGSETVPVYRSGLNFFKEPSYGYQAMDFIINSLMTNNDISEILEEEQKAHDKKPPSILCKGKAEGYYTLDSDVYFNKHKDSKRMGTILEKYKSGKDYNSLTAKEKKIFGREIESPEVAKLLGTKDLFSSTIMEKAEAALYDRSFLPSDLYSGIHPKQTYLKKLAQLNLPPRIMDNFYVYHMLESAFFATYDEDKYEANADTLISSIDGTKLSIILEEIIAQGGYKDMLKLNNYGQEKIQGIYRKLNIKVPASFTKSEKEFIWKTICQKLFEKARIQLEFMISADLDPVPPQIIAATKAAAYVIKPLPETLEEKHRNASEEIKKNRALYFDQAEKSLKKVSTPTSALFKKYFKEVYKKRETVQSASPFPWTRFKDSEIEVLRDRKE